MSSLAAQLAQNASLNSALLAERSKRKPTDSYLFTGREADQHDLESIHALAVNGLLQLVSLNPALQIFEDQLFSENAKVTDRTLLPQEANDDLNNSIEEFLVMLGPYLMETPTGKVIEWLVRRFRINEFNLEAVLSLFLPYHDSPHFAKMVTLLHIKPNSTWSFLLPYKSAAQSLPRVSLVTEMLRNSNVARFVTSLLPTAAKAHRTHRVLLAFNAATLHEFIKRNKTLDEGTVAYVLPALLEPLQQVVDINAKDAILGSYILLSALSQRCELSKPALKTIVGSMTGCAQVVATKQFTSAVVAVCEPQSELEKFSDGTVKNILRLSDIKEELRSVMKWFGSEKFIGPLLNGLGQRLNDEDAASLLEALVTASDIPPSIVERSTRILARQVLVSATPAAVALAARRLLSIIQQRYPSQLHEVMSKIVGDDGTLKEVAEQLIISLSMTTGISTQATTKQNVDIILASASADAKVRSIALKELVNSLDNSDPLSTADLLSIHSALVARVHDTDVDVLEALYEKTSVITPVLIQDPRSYINALSETLCSQGAKPKRGILRLHLSYLASSFCPAADSSVVDEVFHKVLFSFLLFSKPRQHTAELVWDVISEHFDGMKRGAAYDWLAGCTDMIKAEKDKNVADITDKMNNINLALSSKIAQNILMSNNYRASFTAVVSKLQDSNPHIRALGYLIARALLAQLSGEHQIDAAHEILEIMAPEQLSGIEDLRLDSDEQYDPLDDAAASRNIVSKPSSKSTSTWLQISIITVISSIPRPEGLVLDWLTDLSVCPSDDRGHRYIGLMRAVYRLANSSTSVPVLGTYLLRALFMSLKDDALAFLAGIWSDNTASRDKNAHSVALRHGAAFLEAHVLEDDGMDFQTILPSLLVALQDEETQTRQAALECVSRLRVLTDRKLLSVYRFDAIYGQSEQKLQYLDQDDLKRYLSSIVEHRDHFVHDPTYVKVFHEGHIGRTKSDKKRESEYKRRVLCYLLSHVNALTSQSAQVSLLRSVEKVSDKAKAQLLLPLLQSLALAAQSVQPSDIFNSYSEEFTTLVLSCLDATAASDLNEPDSALWEVYLSAIQAFFRSGVSLSSQDTLSHSLQRGLFSQLNHVRQAALCEILLGLGSQDPDALGSCKQLLANILQDVPLIVHLLDSLAPTDVGAAPRASKRAKTTDAHDNTLPRLGLLMEILGTKSLPGSLDLISHLLDTLNKVVQSVSPSQMDVSYIEQLAMSAIENAAAKIEEVPNMSPSAIRLDILVELIRVADNPQTFHQALLLMANLARLAPDSVLHNVMPVFTFMGSNVFHRDDTYSFRVVQQTIDGIVPVMVSSLKKTHTEQLDLYIGSKVFLRVFTDAATHIPRHRRNNFFSHLVDVLGVGDFLPPVCMLLIEKVASRVARQSSDEVQSSLALPMSVLQNKPRPMQILTLVELLLEAQRLVAKVANPSLTQPTFLEGISDSEHAAPSATIMKRRAHALIAFVGSSAKFVGSDSSGSESTQPSTGTLVSHLIALATMQGGATAETRIDDICQAARSSLSRLLGVMSAQDFVNAVLRMLDSENLNVEAGALELLADRLPNISEKARQQVTPSVVKIIEAIKRIIIVQKDGALPLVAFQALKAVGLTLCPKEESSMTDIVPLVISSIGIEGLAPSALGALSPLPSKLGPRIIPFFRDIVAKCITILRDGTSGLANDVFGTLHGLLSSIPTFWGSEEVTQVATLYFDHCTSSGGSPTLAISTLMKAIAKKIPSKVLLPTVIETWSAVNTSMQEDRIVAYFELLTRALRNAARPTVVEHLRRLFTMFLEALDIVKAVSGRENKGEAPVIGAFKELVVKLNEAAFRPLFRRLYDWAFATDEADHSRKVTFCHLYNGLLDFFKGLMNPYMSFLLQPFVQTLKSYSQSAIAHPGLWSSILETLTKSLQFDDGVFWRDDKLRQIGIPLVEQVAVCIRLNITDRKPLLQECLSALIETVTDDSLLKTINLNLLMHTRSEDVQLRLFALTSSETLWRTHGGKLLGFVPETATFIAECSEDENDMVVRESFRLKDAVESVAGKIDGL